MPRPADAMRALSLASIVDKPTEVPPGLLIGLVADFGSIEAWQEAFALEARRKSGSDGWMVLGFSLREGRLLNRWQAADAAELSIEQTTPLLAYQREGPHGSHDQRLDH